VEYPHLQKIQAEYKDKGVAVVMINTDEEAFRVPLYLKKKPAAATVLMKDDKVENVYSVQGIPLTVIIDRKGVIRYRAVGFGAGKENELRKKIDELLSESR
jgi:thiol-disulfide isomerase/thioredoxin